MHYYQFNIGDYASHTRHLSPMEDLAYRRLLDLYYLHERPLNADATVVAKQIGLREHVDAVHEVLKEFFEATPEGYRSNRADREIEHFHSKIEQASRAGKASAQRRINARSTDVQLTNNQEPVTKNQSLEGTNVPSSPPAGEPEGKKGRKKAEDEFPPCSHQSVIDLYHSLCPTLPRVEVWNDVRQGYLRARWREIAADQSKTQEVTTESLLEWWRDFFKFVALSKFLTGRGNYGKDRTPFVADLEWLVRPTNFAKIIENRYHRD